MENNVNGWGTVALWLARRSRRQKDLAQLLGVSAAAISQAKSGKIQLNRRQIALIYQYLEMDEPAIRQWYAEIFDARFRIEPEELQPMA